MIPQTFIPRGLSRSQVGALFDHDVTCHMAGGVIAMGKFIPAGQVLVQHKHPYEHLSILASGTIIVESGGTTQTLVGPCCITIPANTHHGVKALTDAQWYCIHSETLGNQTVDAHDLTEAHEMAERLKGT